MGVFRQGIRLARANDQPEEAVSWFIAETKTENSSVLAECSREWSFRGDTRRSTIDIPRMSGFL